MFRLLILAVLLVTAAFLPPLWAQPAPSAADPLLARGQRLYLRCASCHDITGSVLLRTGPSLRGVVGRDAGRLSGYAYSKALTAADFRWDDDKLDAFLLRPTALVPGTSMAFEGMPVEADRKALIAFLKAAR